jgi:aminoglycoside phosphotransferase (APT) family kinase protein
MSAGERTALRAARARLAAGTPWKEALEALLLELPEDDAERLQQVLREARGAWLGLLEAGGGTALFAGDPLSGTAIALARAGFRVVIAAADADRLWLARARAAADAEEPVAAVRCDPARPPFRAGSFDLAVVEGHAQPEVARAALAVARGEAVLVADNRLGYKRWSGRRGAFRVPRPLEFARLALDPRRPEATLRGYRRRLRGAGAARVRAFALYPHALDFALIAGLEGGGPELFIGPKERENAVKMAGYRLGLLPLAAPSFALIASRASGGRARMERVLDELAERVGEPRPAIRQWIASRGNTSIVQTAAHGREGEDPAGRWTLHVPHQPYQERQARRHFARLRSLAASHPTFPVPAALFAGRLQGLPVFCERRLLGMSAPQLTGRHHVLARTFAEAARQLAGLVVAEPRPLDEGGFEALLGAKFDLVRRYAAVPSTAAALDRLRAEARERLLGQALPLVVYHADLRGKHVMIAPDGAVVGYLDWGSSEDADLPYFDLLHLILHERKQEAGITAGDAWRLLGRPDGLRPAERAALDDYARRVALAPDVRAALEAVYPVLVAAMAEKNWDYSRPRWLHASFGI